MKKCPFCGADIDSSARFCLYCMQSLTEKEQVLCCTKKKPQWSLILAAIVALLLLLVILLPREQQDTALPDGQQLQSLPTSKPSGSTAMPEVATPSGQTVTIPATQSTQPATQPTHPATQSATQPAQPHVHSFTVENTAAKYLKDEATCFQPAQYYYSCACGATGEELFSHGETEHTTLLPYQDVAAGCVTNGYRDGYYCALCECEVFPRTVTPPVGHRYDSADPDATCSVCGEKRASDTPTVELIFPEMPITLSNGYRVKEYTYSIQEQPNGQFRIIINLIITQTSSVTPPQDAYIYDVYVTLSGLKASLINRTKPNAFGEAKNSYTFENVPLDSYEICILTKSEVQQ